MSSKNIPISIRVSEEDASFLAQLEQEGAATLSEKIRALIGEARRRREAGGFVDDAVRSLEDLHLARDRRRRLLEQEGGKHSELLGHLSQWLLETHIAYLTGLVEEGGKADKENPAPSMEAYEAKLADQVFVLIDQILRMGLTQKSRCYNPQLISDRMETLKELISLYNKA